MRSLRAVTAPAVRAPVMTPDRSGDMLYVPYSIVRSSTFDVRPTSPPSPCSALISSALAVVLGVTCASKPTAVWRLTPVGAAVRPICCRKSTW